MGSGMHTMVWMKHTLNAIIILCIPLGLYFAWCVLSSDITAVDWQERLAAGNWSKDALSKLEERGIKKMAARWTFYVFIASVLIRGILSSGLVGFGKRPSQ